MKHTTVVFTQNGARVFNNYKPLPFYNKEKVLVNPNVSHLSDTPPMFWKLEKSQIKEMTRPEKLKVLDCIKDIQKNEPVTSVIYPVKLVYLYLIAAVCFSSALYILYRLVH